MTHTSQLLVLDLEPLLFFPLTWHQQSTQANVAFGRRCWTSEGNARKGTCVFPASFRVPGLFPQLALVNEGESSTARANCFLHSCIWEEALPYIYMRGTLVSGWYLRKEEYRRNLKSNHLEASHQILTSGLRQTHESLPVHRALQQTETLVSGWEPSAFQGHYKKNIEKLI